MYIKQISVFVENRAGAASDILEILSDNGINICALSITDTSDYGIMRLIVNDPASAKKLLSDQGVMVKFTDVLAVPIGDEPGDLNKVLEIIKSGNVSIDYMYAFVSRNHGHAVVVIRTNDQDKTAELLINAGINPLCLSSLISTDK